MKKTIDGTRYNTDECRELASFEHRSYSGNYSGTTRLMEAGDGMVLVWTNTNGQDLHLKDDLVKWTEWSPDLGIDVFDIIKDEKRLVELGLLKICPPVKEDKELLR